MEQLYACQTIQHPQYGWGTLRSYDAATAVVKFRTGLLTIPREEVLVPAPCDSETESVCGRRASLRIPNKVDVNLESPFLQWLGLECLIHGSSPARHRDRFLYVYEAITGRRVDSGKLRYMSFTEEGRAWYYSMRVVFVAPPRDISAPEITHEIHDKPGYQEISSNSFVWGLLAAGFDFGYNSR